MLDISSYIIRSIFYLTYLSLRSCGIASSARHFPDPLIWPPGGQSAIWDNKCSGSFGAKWSLTELFFLLSPPPYLAPPDPIHPTPVLGRGSSSDNN